MERRRRPPRGAPSMQMRIRLQPGNYVTLFLGLLFIASGIYGYIEIGRFMAESRPAAGVVVEIVHASTNKRGRTHPVVRFTTAEGKEVVVRSEEHHNVQPGDTLQLLYDVHHPERIEITTLERVRNQRVIFTVLSILLGAIVCVLGVRQRWATSQLG
jgi:hypothetical protein